MPFDWGAKLFDLVLAGLPGAWSLIPERHRKQLRAKAADWNPFAGIADNEDLVRALRLAWIEAALEVNAAAEQQASHPEWQAASVELARFSDLVRKELCALRRAAFNRDEHPGETPIDEHLGVLLIEVPAYIRAAGGERPGDRLTREFVPTLAATVKWPAEEVPAVYDSLARGGLAYRNSQGARPFGELVFAAFAEIVKSPNDYPEASTAFKVALTDMAREVAIETLSLAKGLDEKFDTLVKQLDAVPYHSLADFGAHVTSTLSRIEGKVDAMPAQMSDTVEAALRKVLAERDAAAGPHVSEQAVIALAQRLKPDEQMDFERALTELRFAVEVAQQVLATGEHPEGHDRFVDEVLRRVAQLTGEGRLEQGAASLDDALAELDRHELRQREAMRARRSTLLESKLRQTVLLRDVEEAAETVYRLGALEDEARPAWSEAYEAKLNGFYDEGRDRGVNLSLEVAVALARRRLATAATPDERGAALNWLGNALGVLGQRESGTARLEKAVAAHRLALEEHTRERVPLAWATTQNNLGNALRTLGERETGTTQLEAAAAAYRLSLEERTRGRVPLDWAATQTNLGSALRTLGQRESGTARLEEAVAAYRLALEEQTRERVPLAWAATQTNLGSALSNLGQRESGTARLKEAVAAYRLALEERTRERVPLDWATTQNNLGNALSNLGQRESGTARLEEAVAACLAALDVLMADAAPWHHEIAARNLEAARVLIAQRRGKA
jgi:tetratricopeptide (TPR) repeat protein